MEQTELRRLLLWATVSALSLTALFAIFALLTGSFGHTQLRILATTGGCGLASLLAMPGTRLLEQLQHVDLGRLVVFMAVLTFVGELWALWIGTESDVSWRALAVAVSVTVALSQIAGSLARRRPSDPEAVPLLGLAAGVCALVLALLVSVAALAKVGDSGYYRLLGVVAVLDVLLVSLQGAVRRFGAPPAGSSASAASFVCVLADGRRIRPHAVARDLPGAVAAALREFERQGERVRRIELAEE
jgi:Na+-transporting NADH:ubiquinone oxidoreductase subunit NqrB